MMQIRRRNKRPIEGQLILTALAVGLGSFLATPAQAQDSFENTAVQFPVNTVVEFEFKESHGAYQSTLGVVNLDTREEVALFTEVKPYNDYQTAQPQVPVPGQDNTNTPRDYLGTVDGGTVQNRLTEYTFKANTPYAFYLESVSPTGQTRRSVLSSDALAATFDGSLDSGTRDQVTGSRIKWDDSGLPQAGKDNDYDDFIIEAGGFLINPCPPVR